MIYIEKLIANGIEVYDKLKLHLEESIYSRIYHLLCQEYSHEDITKNNKYIISYNRIV